MMDAFKGAIDSCGFRDLGFGGSIFTWKRGTTLGNFVRERLDRLLADSNWCSMFPHYNVCNFPMYCSDHTQFFCLLLIIMREVVIKKKAFKFEAIWLSNA